MKRKFDYVGDAAPDPAKLREFGDPATRDVVLFIGPGEERFEAHLGVLASYVPWFARATSSGMVEAREKKYKFIEDSVEGWESLLSRVYPPNTAITTERVASIVPLMDKYDIGWLKGEVVTACKRLSSAGRTACLIDALRCAGLTDVLDTWLGETDWLAELQQNEQVVDELQTLDACRYILKYVLKRPPSCTCKCMTDKCYFCNCCAGGGAVRLKCRTCTRADSERCTVSFVKGHACPFPRCPECKRCSRL